MYLTRDRSGQVGLARDPFFQPKEHGGGAGDEAPRLARNKSGGLSGFFG